MLSILSPSANKSIIKLSEVGEVTGYTTTHSDDTFTITNTHEVERTKVEGIKTWNDNDNQDGLRPDKVIVRLYANGEEFLVYVY